MSKANPIFNIRTFEAADLRNIDIEDVSEGLSFGRRFKMQASDNSCSEALLMKDIFDDLKKIAKKAKKDGDITKLEAVNILLGRLDTANTDANIVYDTKGCLYHFLTSVSRLFSFGSHSKRISDLQEVVTTQINLLDPVDLNPAQLDPINPVQIDAAERLIALKNLPDTIEKKSDLSLLAHELMELGDYVLCLEAIKATPRCGDAGERFIAEMAESFLENDQLEKALETKKLSSNFGTIDTFIGKVADKYFENREYEKGVETIESVTSLINLGINFIKKTLDVYIENKEYVKAWELLPKLRGDKIPYALKLGNSWCTDNDLEKAYQVAAFIVEQDYLYTHQKMECEILIKLVVDAFCEKGEPDKALELVEPMKVVSRNQGDSALKNELLEKITDAYIDLGKLEKALTTVENIWQDFKMENKIIMKVAEAHYNFNEYKKALEAIAECNGLHYRKEIRELTQKYQDAL